VSSRPRAFDIEAEPLPDTSHTNHRITLDDGRRMLLRRLTDAERGDDPWYVARDEVAALVALSGSGIPVPGLLAADPDASTCDVPTLLVTWLPGLTPASRIADRRAIERCARSAPWHRARFIHRDYHHGNTLFERDRLTGIIDWTTGCTGPIGIDLAQMRLNLAWSFDLELADAFLDAWRTAVGQPDGYDPYWDVLDAIDWLGDDEPDAEHTQERLARYEAFTARALSELG
jgi:aminoglycoside phosphotransferase (APT) family kinase protein